MVTIGDKTLASSQTLILADGEVAKYPVTLKEPVGDAPAVTLNVTASVTTDGENEVRWELDSGELKFTLQGMCGPLGSGSQSPVLIASLTYLTLWFSLSHHMVGNGAHLVTIQILTRDEK